MASSIITGASSSLEQFTSRARPKISIDLDGQQTGLVNSYTTGDCIQGTVTITADHDIRFDDVDITFEGTPNIHIPIIYPPHLII